MPLCFGIANLFGHLGGSIVVTVLLIAACAVMWLRSRASHVGSHNVAEEWEQPKGERKREIDRELQLRRVRHRVGGAAAQAQEAPEAAEG